MRNKTIDNLRGLSILAMMAIHANAYFLDNLLNYFFWNFFQWAVPVFLFCSFFLTFSLKKELNFKKRFFRLYRPYLIFLIFYFLLLFFFEKQKFNLSYFLANIFLYGGIDYNWLVLLFLGFIFLTPLFFYLKKNKFLFYGFFLLSFFSSIFFIFYPPKSYRFFMFLPWILIVYFAYFFVQWKKSFWKIGAIIITSLFSFLITFFLEKKIGHNLSQFANKYPPTLYHLSYGVFSTTILYQLSEINFFDILGFDRLLNFLSVNSYSLYFVHILVMDVLTWTKVLGRLNNVLFFILIFLFSSLIVYGYSQLSRWIFLLLKNKSKV